MLDVLNWVLLAITKHHLINVVNHIPSKDSSAANEESRSKAILGTIEKNEHSFRPKATTVPKETSTAHTIGSLIETETLNTTPVEISLHDDNASKRTDGVST